jgi:HPt (histidine-containing phosphotransfer) domain-containing protein
VSDPVAEALRELRREYHAESPARIAELQRGLAALAAGEDGAETDLVVLFHRLAGSGGAYGFPQVSTTARELERLLRSEPHWTPARLAEVEAGIQEIADAFSSGSAP